MKVHTSNYRIEGFTSEVAETELAGLASEHNLPFVMDLGSGSLLNLGKFGLPAEPTAGEVIAMGAGVVTFSGDKLLGGPQCGLIAGEAELIDRINANPLKRALRADKLTLAGITAVLNLYRNPDAIRTRLPTLRHLTRTQDEMRTQAQRLVPLLADSLGAGFHVEIVDSEAQVGSGSLPSESIASTAIAISAAQERKDIVRSLASAFRNLPTPVIGHAHKGRLLLDLRCLDDEQGFIAQLEHLQV